VILADTSVWVDYLRGNDAEMCDRLQKGQVAMHPFIAAEISLRSLRNRKERLEEMESLLEITVAQLSEVRHMIESHALYSRGIGLTDAHLLASCLITPGTQLWTRDAALRKVAESLGVMANLT
jgi:predicted nucleic acid-binding protein